MGSSSFATKFLITCLIVSVEITVEIPNRLPKSEDRVLFPVPEVPAKRTKIFLLDSILIFKDVCLTNKVGSDIKIFKVLRPRIFVLINKVLFKDIFEQWSRDCNCSDMFS
jgi:hypothetical protein